MEEPHSGDAPMAAFGSGEFSAFDELVRAHQGRVYGYLVVAMGVEASAAAAFVDGFITLVDARSNYDDEYDADVFVYRALLRGKRRHEPAPEAARQGELAQLLRVVEPDDRDALVFFESSGLGIHRAAEALRRPLPRLQEAIADALARVTAHVAAAELANTGACEIEDRQLGLTALGWVEPEERVEIEACASARARIAAMESVRDHLRTLLPPRDPPPALVAKLRERAEARFSQTANRPPPPKKRIILNIAAAMGLVALLAGGVFSAWEFVLKPVEKEPEPVAEVDEPELPLPAAPEPKIDPPLPSGIEIAAQGPPLPLSDPRLKKAAKFAQRKRCKKAAKLAMRTLAGGEDKLPAVKTSMRGCEPWLEKARGDAKLGAFATKVVGKPAP